MKEPVRYRRPVTICGLAGVGKSTARRLINEELGFTLHSTGDHFREEAKRLFPDKSPGEALALLEKKAETDYSIDRMIDARSIKLETQEERWILDSRLGWHFCPCSFKILLHCQEEVRIARIAARDKMSYEEAARAIAQREASIRERYFKLYNIVTFTNPRLFDIALDTTTQPAEEVAAQILDAYKNWHTD